jgi:cell division protein FtsN
MLRSSESETEILLGNKQLLGIFFVVVALLGVAFVGGYKVGEAAGKKAPVTAQANTEQQASSSPAASSATAPTPGETHALPAASGTGEGSATAGGHSREAENANTASSQEAEPPLGSPKRAKALKTKTIAQQNAPGSTDSGASTTAFAPQGGQTFLQVAAVSRDEAEATADVLHKKGFRAHAVPKPGATKIYRVLIGPIRDAGDLASTRDSLHKIGFREIFVQRY